MAKYETISVKVPAELKEEAKKRGIKTGEVMRKALELEVKRDKLRELEERLEPLQPVLDKIDIQEVVAMIREDREKR